MPWAQWHPDEEIVCESSGKRFQLPNCSPYAIADLARETGRVRCAVRTSRRNTSRCRRRVGLPEWSLVCPATGLSCTLPATLSPLPAPRGSGHSPGCSGAPTRPMFPCRLNFLPGSPASKWNAPRRTAYSSRRPRSSIGRSAPRSPVLRSGWSSTHLLRAIRFGCRSIAGPRAPLSTIRATSAKSRCRPDLPLLVGELVEQKGGIDSLSLLQRAGARPSRGMDRGRHRDRSAHWPRSFVCQRRCQSCCRKAK